MKERINRKREIAKKGASKVVFGYFSCLVKMKNILLGVTGGIAAYKVANIVSLLRKKGYNVKIVMTENATKIITPQTLETLSRNRVVVDMWERGTQMEVEHISLADWADLILIAPATFNVVGKIANGIADDMLTTVVSAFKKTVYFALAMNVNMYENPILLDNIEKLKRYGYRFIEADTGFLACNVEAKGRLKNEKDIVEIVESNFVEKIYSGKSVLITAGRTEEALDPVRYFSNKSSGKMGYSLAKKAVQLGAKVTLVSGPTDLEVPLGVTEFIGVRSANDMYTAVMDKFEKQDIIISCAAVADYKPKVYSEKKIKKQDGELVIVLERNPDILYELGKRKNGHYLVGFAAETEDILSNAMKKLERKNLDLIVGNSATNMQSDSNKIVILHKSGKIVEFEEKGKEEVAEDILREILSGISISE